MPEHRQIFMKLSQFELERFKISGDLSFPLQIAFRHRAFCLLVHRYYSFLSATAVIPDIRSVKAPIVKESARNVNANSKH